MKVWIVEGGWTDSLESYILGVFNSYEKAMQYKQDTKEKKCDFVSILEWEVS